MSILEGYHQVGRANDKAVKGRERHPISVGVGIGPFMVNRCGKPVVWGGKAFRIGLADPNQCGKYRLAPPVQKNSGHRLKQRKN